MRPLSCGKCHGCRGEQARQWAVRCVHEAQLHEQNCFVTLTYAKAPECLDAEDMRLFLRRVRARFGRVRYYYAGEHGELNGRPHFHALLFGVDFHDRVPWGESPSGFSMDRSATLEALWPHGFSSVGDVTFKSAAYVARYVMKKVGDNLSEAFCRMSRMPGIGARWYELFGSDVRKGQVVIDGAQMQAPRFYMRRLKAEKPFVYRRVMALRDQAARDGIPEQLPGRLEARSAVALARRSQSKRKI